MATASVRARDQDETGQPVWRAAHRAPLLFLAAACSLVALGAALVATHITSFALDEAVIEQSAVHYTHDFPHSLFHDLDARATNRLYPLVLSVAFRLFNGVTAIQIDRLLSVLLFVSTALPVYMVARIVVRSVWSAAAVALLSIAIPWLTLTSVLFTENLSYPLFWWSMLALCRAVWRPSLRADALALLSIALLVCTRVQFAAVFVGYLVALLGIMLWRVGKASATRAAFASCALRSAGRHAFTVTALAGMVAAFVYERASGRWELDVERLFGAYSEVLMRNILPPNMVQGSLVEMLALALGVGLLPAIVSFAWYARQLSRPRDEIRWVFIVSTGVIGIAFTALTVYSQGGYLGSLTEERYFFYLAPLFWLGTFAALEDHAFVSRGAILGCSLAFAALFGAIPFLSPFNSETAFLAPVETVVPHVLLQRFAQLHLSGLAVQDALVVIVLLAGVVTTLLWHRKDRLRWGWTVGAAAAVQLLITGYAYAMIGGSVQGVPGRTGGSVGALGWIDKQTHGQPATWLEGMPPGEIAVYEQRTTLFWNSSLLDWATVPQLGLAPVDWPLVALPGSQLSVDMADGQLQPQAVARSMRWVVGVTNSPFLQLAGTIVAHSPDRDLSLTKVVQPGRASWLAVGLPSDGSIAAGSTVRLLAFVRRSESPQAITVKLTFSAVPPVATPTSLEVRFGSVERHLALSHRHTAATFRAVLCFAPRDVAVRGYVRPVGTAKVAGHSLAGSLSQVSLSPVSSVSARRCGRRIA